jgi:hypothetical protein
MLSNRNGDRQKLVTIYRMGSRHSFNDWNWFQYNQLEETSNQVVSTEIQN